MAGEETTGSALAGMDDSNSAPDAALVTATAADHGLDAEKSNATNNSKDSNNSSNKPKPKRRGPKPKIKLPVEPRVIHTVPKRKEYVNHSYNDFSNVPPGPDYSIPTQIDSMSFSEKVFDILSQPENTKYIAWRPHGRAFCVTVPVMFEKHVCQKYFGHKRYSSFLRQVNNHGFKHITAGVDRNCYYHECFLKGMMHLCKFMPEPKDSRRQIADPTNEPDFDAISRLYPVPPPIVHANVNANGTDAMHPTTGLETLNTHGPSVGMVGLTAGANPLGLVVSGASEVANPKMGMDRDAAMAEMQSLRARLASETNPASSSSDPSTEPPSKRQATLSSGLLGQTPVRQLARMPNPFPTRARGLSQLESILERNAIVSGIRKQKEQEAHQQQKMQEIQVQQKFQEFLVQHRQLEEFQQRQHPDGTTETFPQLQTPTLDELQKQQALQLASMSQVLPGPVVPQQQMPLQQPHVTMTHAPMPDFRHPLFPGLAPTQALPPLAMPPMQAPPAPTQMTNLSTPAAVGEYLRMASSSQGPQRF